jgi:penicillin-binding protein-related factor A (putative recombinase)
MFTGLTKVWAGPICMINVNEPKLVQQVLTSEKCWTKSKMVYDQVPFGEGLFTAYNCKNHRISDNIKLKNIRDQPLGHVYIIRSQDEI